jgi:hypothetical protein
MPQAPHYTLLATYHLPHALQCQESAPQQVSGLNIPQYIQEEWSFP